VTISAVSVGLVSPIAARRVVRPARCRFLEVLALERTLGRLPRGELDVRGVNSSLVCTIASRSTSSLVISST